MKKLLLVFLSLCSFKEMYSSFDVSTQKYQDPDADIGFIARKKKEIELQDENKIGITLKEKVSKQSAFRLVTQEEKKEIFIKCLHCLHEQQQNNFFKKESAFRDKLVEEYDVELSKINESHITFLEEELVAKFILANLISSSDSDTE